MRPLAAGDLRSWDVYVQGHPRATFFHQLGWKRVLEATFPYRAHYLVAERDGRVCGVLPLFACRSIKGKLSLYSLPHTVYGGVIGDDAECELALLEAARALGRSLGAHAIELRNRYPTLLELPATEGCVTFEGDLGDNADDVRRLLPKKVREMVNQAIKRHKLEADFDGGLDEFYDLLAACYLKLGTPVFPKRMFRAILGEFPRDSNVLIVRHEGVAVASVLSVYFRGIVMPLYSGEAPGVKNLKANNYKYYRLMQEAIQRGATRFDFGRSRATNTGVVKFKASHGYDAEPLPYQVDMLRPGAASGPADPNTGLYLKLRQVWKKLPARVASVVGPPVVRFFP